MSVKDLVIKNASVAERAELLAGVAARRRELDKAFKACMKSDLQQAAEKVHERMRTLDRLKEELERE